MSSEQQRERGMLSGCIPSAMRPLDGVPLVQDGDTVSSHLRQGPTPHPSRARVTATAKIIQREGSKTSLRFAGIVEFSHFAPRAIAAS